MLITATEARNRANQAILSGKVNTIERGSCIGLKDTLEGKDEIELIGNIIENESGEGKIECDFDFEFSDKTTVLLESFLYYVVKENKKSIVGW